MSYTKPTLSGYNANPPPDDGSEATANEIKWSTHKVKIGDPLKNYADAINQAAKDAFDTQFLNAVTSISIDYTVQATDRGKVLNVSNGAAITLPAAASVGGGFAVVVRNANGDSVVVTGAEQVNGRGSHTVSEGEFSAFVSNGAAWNAIGKSAEDPVIIDDGTNIRVTGMGFGTSDQFTDWFGPRPANGNISLCSEATAVFYRKTSGDEYTSGTVLAGGLTNSGQTTSTLDTAVVTVGPFSTNGAAKTVSVSYAYTRNMQISDPAAYSGSASATLVLERSFDGSAWTQIGSPSTISGSIVLAIDGAGAEEPGMITERIAGSFLREDADATVSATIRYRARLTARTLHTITSTILGTTVAQTIDLISVE